METLPLFHRLSGQPVLVLGEGEAAAAKARLVEEAGGTVVTEAGPGVRLAFVALDPPEPVVEALKAKGLLVNVPDRPDLCDFFVPAIVDRTPLLLAVGTGGASASLSKALKERLEHLLPASLGALAVAIRQSRETVAAALPDVPARRAFWAGVLAPGAALDPFAPHGDPLAAITNALAGGGEAENRIDTILIDEGGADALTLRELRLLAQADLLVQAPGVPAEVLALARRDAARVVGTEAPEGSTGRIVLIALQPHLQD
ncbi:siroheme synthase [Sandaracinobacter neustonicus]|uniref:precorrin-2 dehydrogenase n=1 Tax=Sandaracinobacter neustonicus TaxID=1715348 RepID=A0A501XHH6_9SPHN|nr:bifunctional precorrin-2 dehydrogenase/sirohydrochlorin ferrochelatase [Sandaracinobacter neustonicus]TPE60062.1 siroheme synthase [Sandaracinobacter neustonicus]